MNAKSSTTARVRIAANLDIILLQCAKKRKFGTLNQTTGWKNLSRTHLLTKFLLNYPQVLNQAYETENAALTVEGEGFYGGDCLCVLYTENFGIERISPGDKSHDF